MGLNEKFFKSVSVAPVPFTPRGNFETVTYTGNGGTQKITGYIRKGASFNGSSSKILAPTSFTNTQDVSISFWAQGTVAPSSSYRLFFQGGGNDYFYIAVESDGEVYAYPDNYQDSVYPRYSTKLSTSNSGVTDGGWHHIVVVNKIESSANGGGYKIYVDGTLNASVSFSSTLRRNAGQSAGIGIGSGNSGTNAFFEGKIDQLRIFDTAITSDNVNTLYLETSASSTKSTVDIFGNGSGVALYEMEDNANDTGNNYNGTATNVDFLGMNFQPDLVWIKQRSGTQDQMWYDSNRGAGNYISSNNLNAEGYANSTVTSFDSNGFSVGSSNSENQINQTYVAWCWKANGAAVTNTDGSVDSQVSANVAAGFSIVKSTYTTQANYTVGHGLSQRPEIVIAKNLDQGDASYGQWYVFPEGATGNNGDYFRLNGTVGISNFSYQFITATTIAYHTGFQVTGTNKSIISYAFHSVSNYQKIGTYTGSGTTKTISTEVTSGDGGFEPRWILIKNTKLGAFASWWMYDAVRNPSNPRNTRLVADANYSEATNTSGNVNFNSNSFDLLGSYQGTNKNNDTYIYLVIA